MLIMMRLKTVFHTLWLWVHKFWRIISSVVVVIAAIFAIVVFVCPNGSEKDETTGVLTPGNEPTPDIACFDDLPPPPDSCILIVGNGVAYSTHFPFTVLRVRDEDLLSVDKNEYGMWVDAKIYDRDGIVIADIQDNNFEMNLNNNCRIEQDDQHSLELYDRYDELVLDVEYLNPSTMRFIGTVYYPDIGPIIFSEDKICYGGYCFDQLCTGETSVAIHIQ